MGFHDAVIYQIYPKSFYDSTGSGTGDLRGVIEKIPYIASLGIDMIWFNPFFVSPQNDNGYDISDYFHIDPAMGTMEDFDELVTELGKHNIGVMLDMVLNHTSTHHEWFQKAIAGDPKYQAYYYLRPPQKNGSLPTNWVSKFGGPAWAPFGDTGLYYLHLFDPSQADVDWHNPRLREEMAKVVQFWHERGVKGFRFDVINLIGKENTLLDAPEGTDDRLMYTDGELVPAYLKELAARSFGQDPNAITVGEMSSTSIERCIEYTNPDNKELSMVFNFHHLKVDYDNGQKWSNIPFNFGKLKKIFDEWARGMQDGGGWNALFWNNHDQPRAINRFGDANQYRIESATMLATAIHFLRGTPYIYMGEEIGMTDPAYTSINDYVDIEATNAFKELTAAGMTKEEAFAIIHAKARDNSRTPMQWSNSANAGFTTGTPWLRPTNFEEINVESEVSTGKILPYYKKLIQLRKKNPIISEGKYETFAPDHTSVFAYIRTYKNQKLLVLTNFYGENTSIDIPEEFTRGTVLISNYENSGTSPTVKLKPYEALAIIIR